jgi:hypothetical protein
MCHKRMESRRYVALCTVATIRQPLAYVPALGIITASSPLPRSSTRSIVRSFKVGDLSNGRRRSRVASHRTYFAIFRLPSSYRDRAYSLLASRQKNSQKRYLLCRHVYRYVYDLFFRVQHTTLALIETFLFSSLGLPVVVKSNHAMVGFFQ